MKKWGTEQPSFFSYSTSRKADVVHFYLRTTSTLSLIDFGTLLLPLRKMELYCDTHIFTNHPSSPLSFHFCLVHKALYGLSHLSHQTNTCAVLLVRFSVVVVIEKGKQCMEKRLCFYTVFPTAHFLKSKNSGFLMKSKKTLKPNLEHLHVWD